MTGFSRAQTFALESGAVAVVAVLALAIAIGLGSTRRTSAHEHGPSTLSLSVGKPTGQTIPAGFLGLSLEYPAVLAYTGSDRAAINPVLVQLIRNLSPNQSPNLRIGGDTTDWTWWPVPGVRQPRGVRYTIGPDWAAVVAALANDLRAKLILGVNLEVDSANVAGTEARDLIARIGADSIEALELGNEPELYGSFTWTTPLGRARSRYGSRGRAGPRRSSGSRPRAPRLGPA